MSDLKDFNIDKLNKQLFETVEKDKQYWLENDAKIRAVKQGVPSYDHFRFVSLGKILSHLLFFF